MEGAKIEKGWKEFATIDEVSKTDRLFQEDFERWIVFIIGNSKCCFAFTSSHRIISIKCSLDVLDSEVSQNFLRVNYYTIINTRFFVKKSLKREITMKDGSVHKVSRQKWKGFK